MLSPSHVFEPGRHKVRLLHVDPHEKLPNSAVGVPSPPPPKPLLIASPSEEGEFPVLVFLHGYLLYNSFYTQLIQHIASNGFIIVAPQLYCIAGPDSTDEIKSISTTINWLIDGLPRVLPATVQPNLTCGLGLAGHSRGGKVAFALALGHAKTAVKISALMGIDPVDGMEKGKQTNPPVLTHIPRSLNLGMPVLVVGSALGEVKRNSLFPPCAPKGVSHQDFFDECRSPACHFIAKDFGHLDMLDDETKGIRGKATYCLCASGKARKPMRAFVGGVMVAFLRAYLEGDARDLLAIRDNPAIAPIELSTVRFLEQG